ncbi:MAG: putative membrane protein YfcA [Arenicella sp.]
MIDLNYAPFFLLALLGAIVANSTGAGGGIVFVPAFKLLGIDHASIIATSFAIQCFGMSAGSLAWWRYSRKQNTKIEPAWREYGNLVRLFALPTIIGVVFGQTVFQPSNEQQTIIVFKLFSVIFAIAILVTTYQLRKTIATGLSLGEVRSIKNNRLMRTLFYLTGFVGGAITAWLSIGVGELVAILLILLRYPVALSVGVAVSVSAIAVWMGVQKYIWFSNGINLDILVFAGPAALIGGTLARRLASYLSPIQLKIVIAGWVMASAIVM